jgi:F-type H+-transporting ATPase subunit b
MINYSYLAFLNVIFNSEGIHLNNDLFETNLINILIILAVLIFFGGKSVDSSLSARKENILRSIEDSEKELNSVKFQFFKAKNNLKQGEIVLKGINQEATSKMKNLLNDKLQLATRNIRFQFENAKSNVEMRKVNQMKEIKQQFISLTFSNAIRKIEEYVDSNTHSLIISKKIDYLESGAVL